MIDNIMRALFETVHVPANSRVKHRMSFLLPLAVSCLAGCGSGPVGTDAVLTSENRDQAQRQMSRPSIDRALTFETVAVGIDIEAPVAKVEKWFGDTGARAFSSFGGTDTVPGAVRAEPLSGNWHKQGDRQRLVFSDGNSEIAELTDRKPDLLQYAVWNSTSRIGRYTSYAVSEIEFSGTGQTTRVHWTYAFKPKMWPDGWFIRSYVQNDFRQFMAGALAAMRTKILVELAAPPARPSRP
jgi:hypothetical protein